MSNNRRNSDFQIAHFLAGSKYTPDGAYALLCDLREERELALAESEAHALRSQAKALRARRLLASEDEAARLEGAADLAEIDAHAACVARNVAGARAELDTINECIRRIQPHRRFAHLPDCEAHQAAQRDEWRAELIARAENYLLTSGTLPADQLAAMRQHPDFAEAIWPAIEETRQAIEHGRSNALVTARLSLVGGDE